MTEQDIKNLFNQWIDDYASQNLNRPSKIPFHEHNGTDSAQVNFINLSGVATEKVTDATVAPTDTPQDETIRFLYDGTKYVMWVRINQTWQKVGNQTISFGSWSTLYSGNPTTYNDTADSDGFVLAYMEGASGGVAQACYINGYTPTGTKVIGSYVSAVNTGAGITMPVKKDATFTIEGGNGTDVPTMVVKFIPLITT